MKSIIQNQNESPKIRLKRLSTVLSWLFITAFSNSLNVFPEYSLCVLFNFFCKSLFDNWAVFNYILWISSAFLLLSETVVILPKSTLSVGVKGSNFSVKLPLPKILFLSVTVGSIVISYFVLKNRLSKSLLFSAALGFLIHDKIKTPLQLGLQSSLLFPINLVDFVVMWKMTII